MLTATASWMTASSLPLTLDCVTAQIMVRSHPVAVAESSPEEGDHPDIHVVGVGTFGVSVMQQLAKNLAGIRFHEIVWGGTGGDSSSEFALLLSTLRTSDVVFILTAFDDGVADVAAQILGAAAVDSGGLVMVVTGIGSAPPQGDDGTKWHDVMYDVSDLSLPDHKGALVLPPTSLMRHALRHVVTTITALITHRTGICIDFADVRAIMQSGQQGAMGVGIGTGDDRGVTAAMNAIERLTAQGVNVSSATGILAAVHCSGDLMMKEFDDAIKVIHDHASDDANIVVGVISDELVGGNVKVTVLTVHSG